MKRVAREPEKAREADRGLSRKEVAELTGINPAHLANMAVYGGGPPYRKLKPGKRGKVVYLESEVLNWLKGLPRHGGGQQ